MTDLHAAPHGARSSEPFVGRAGELRSLDAELDKVRGGTPRLAIVEGAAGIGKTRLVDTFLERAEDVRVVRAWGDEAERTLTFGLLEQIWPAFDVAPPGGPTLSDPHAVGAYLLQAIGEAQDDSPLVLFVDDIQWADPPSAHAIVFAFRRLHADRVLLVACIRDEDLASLDPRLGRVIAAGRGATIRLAGLTNMELRELSERMGLSPVPTRVIERLHQLTLGNPLHVGALLREVSAETLADPTTDVPAPRAFSVLILKRLATCSRECEQLVAAVSVLGDRIPLDGAAQVAGISQPARALQEACDAGLLRHDAWRGGAVVSVEHPLIRSAVYGDLGPARRAKLHSLAVEVVDDAGAIVHRTAASGGEDAALAADLVGLAEREAQASSWPSAAGHMLSAWRLTPAGPDRDGRLLAAIELLVTAGQVWRAEGLREELEAVPPGPARFLASAGIAHASGHPDVAKDFYRRAWNSARTSGDDGLRGLIAAGLARHCLYVELDGAAAGDWTEKALTLGFAYPWATIVRTWAAVGLGLRGRIAEALELLERPQASVRLGSLDGVGTRGFLKMWSDDLVGAIADLSLPARYASVIVNDFALLCLAGQAEAEFRAGDWDAASAHADLAVTLAVDSEQRWLLGHLHGVAALAPANRGDWDVAQAHVGQALAAADEVGGAVSRFYASMAAVELAAARADDDAVVEAAGPLDAMRDRDGVAEPGVERWRARYIEALVGLGLLEEAEREIASAEELALARGRRSAIANAARARGILEEARGDIEASRASFEAGLEYCDACGAHDRARFELSFGALLRRSGRRRAATEHLRAAAEVFNRLRARPYAMRCERELAACGLRPTQRKGRDVSALTPQESAVARLVSSGLSNKGVAAELVVSVKTVEFHLSNVYAKLGVSSRTQLISAISGRGAQA